MKDEAKSRGQLLSELKAMRQRVADLQQSETDPGRAEESLQESEQRLKIFLQSSPIPAFVIDKGHRVLYWNKALEELSGIRAADILGTSQHWRAFYSEERPCMADLLVGERADLIHEWYGGKYTKSKLIEGAFEATDFFPTVGGRGTWMRFTAAVMRNSKGEIIGALETLEDVTEQKKAEESLKQVEENYRSLFDEAPVGYHEVDMDGYVVKVNQTELKMLGYAAEEMLGQPIWKFTAEPERVEQVFRAKIAGDLAPGQAFERTYRRKDGTTFIVIAEDNFLKDRLDRTTRIRTTIQDITERKRTEEYITKLGHLKHRLLTRRSLHEKLKLITDGVVEIFGADFARIWIIGGADLCEKGCDHAGVTTGPDVCHDRAHCLHLEVSSGRYTHISGGHRRVPLGCYKIGRVASGDNAKFITNDVTHDRQVHNHDWAEALGLLSFAGYRLVSVEGKTIGVLALFKKRAIPPDEERLLEDLANTTSQVILSGTAEEALQKSEGQARKLAQENAIMAEIGRIISSTLDIEKVYERFAEEVRKVIPFDRIVIDLGNPEQQVVTLAYVSGIDIPGRRVGDVISYAGSDTEYITHMKSSLFIQTDDENEISRRFPPLLATFRAGIRSMMSIPLISKDQVFGGLHFRSVKSNDYTESELRLAERIGNQIAGAIANARLFAERQKLEERLRRAEKMEALGTLAGGVAHDLNNVLGVLVGYSELLLMEIPEENTLRGHVSNILKSGQRAAAIIQDLLTLARRGIAVSEVVHLNRIITEYFMTPEFERLKAYHPLVSFRSDLDKCLLNIKGSPIHLTKTIMNLLSNAAEAIADHGEVTILTENCYLDKPVTGYDQIQEGDYVVLKVSDNGKGISTKDLGKIFEPFYTKKVMGRSGTGLGLAVVWGTVKDHHGYIDVQSEEGRGSTFTLYFPVTREDMVRTSDQGGVSPEAYQGKGESILVVDDVKEQRELATTMLGGLGYRPHAVSSGEEAVAYLKTNPVDLLVLDMIMDPGIDGLETYQRALKINPNQRVVIVSGFSETERVKAAQALGAGTYVRKPYIRENLGLAVRRELDR